MICKKNNATRAIIAELLSNLSAAIANKLN